MSLSPLRRLAALFLLVASFALPAPAASPQSVYTLHSFPPVGTQTMERTLDHAAGTLLRASDGNYYGILTSVYRTLQHPANAGPYYKTDYSGEVYKITPGGVRTVLHTFTSPANNGGLDYYGSRACGALVQGKDGLLYGTTYFGGDNALGQVFKMRLSGVTTTLFSFKGGDGFYPQAGLVEGADGNFYGTAAAGGANGKGVVYRISPTGARGVLHSFAGGAFDGASPKSEMARGADGNFYGVTPGGGANGKGVVYKITPAGVVTVLHSFGGADGSAPVGGLTFGFDGALYGTTYAGGANNDGVVFKLTTTGTYTRLHSFVAFSEGSGPSTRLTRGADGRFYGTTGNGLFVVSSSGGLVKLVTFTGPNGQGVLSALILGGNGNFFGTTSRGGVNGGGTIFECAPLAAFTKLYDFPGTDGILPISLLLGKDGNFYGVTYNNKTGVGDATVFKFTPSGTLTNLHRFNYIRPNTGLIQGKDGALYGTGGQTGADGFGAGGVYKITTTGVVTALHDFEGGGDAKHEGSTPFAGLIQGTDGYFYGTNYTAGLYGGGTVFRMNTVGAILPLHQFALSEGYAPQAALMQASDGNFYGVTGRGGIDSNSGEGSVFKMTPSGAFTVLHKFNPAVEQVQPLAALVEGKDGALYGSTAGIQSYGALFKITKTGVLTTLHNFTYDEGGRPLAPLLLASDGNFYGTISTGAQTTTGGVGAVFKLTPDGSVTIIHSFTGPDGAATAGNSNSRPGFSGALIQGKDGALYGVADAGGAFGTSDYTSGYGTIFKLDIGLGPKTPATVLVKNDASAPMGFSFASATVPSGTPVTWLNQSTAPHSIVWDSRAPTSSPLPGANIPVFSAGAKSTMWTAPQVTVSTTYRYHCGIHGTTMVGTIVVTP